MGIGRSIWSQEDKKSESGGNYKRDVESSEFLFSLVVEPVEILFLVGGASGWLVSAAVATVFGGGGDGSLWKKDGMECDDGIVAPFCFPFFIMINGRSELTTMSVTGAEVEGGGGWGGRGKLASALG